MLKRNNQYYEDIDDLSGLIKKSSFIIFIFMLVILFSLAGIPPLAGFLQNFIFLKLL